MRLSESLRRGIIRTVAGGIINRFKIRSRRRDTLFFEELLARYILECEKEGYDNDIRKIGEEWGFLTCQKLIPDTIKKLPHQLFFNTVLKNVWHNLGLVDDLHIEKNNTTLHMTTKNEVITRQIGANKFMPGFYNGVIMSLFNSFAYPLEPEQEREACNYVFLLERGVKAPIRTDLRSKCEYDKINSIPPIKGYTLKDALKKNILCLRGNRIHYRNKVVVPLENTLFHIVGKANILPEKMAAISYDFFKEAISRDTSRERKLRLFKTLFQVMGWGAITIVVKPGGKISVEFRRAPSGLLPEDNWNYIIRTVLGYLWLIDKELSITAVRKTKTGVLVNYA